MNRSNGPISPLSMNNANSFASRYGSGASGPPPVGGTPNDVPYAGGPYGAARPAQASPPGSQHPSGSTDASRPSVSSSTMRPPSSASSLGGRSDGRMGFGGPGGRDSGRSTFQPENEEALQRHYHVLKGYLAASLRDEKGNLKPNRARDKLLRLSVTQFMELSTDVFDELVRREDDRLQRVKDVPRFLLPKPMFHPKRNQARQKLSTLPIERFRQLATDVFYELERRIPRFGGDEIDRPTSTTSNGPPGSRAPSRGGMRGPPPPGYRGPPGGPGRPPMPPGPNGMGPPQMPYQSFRPNSPGMNGPPGPPPPGPMRRPSEQSEPGSLGRPLPKTFQSNTIVPNKSTMVEDDDEDDEDTFGLDKGVRYSEAPSSSGGNEKDRGTIKSQEAEITRLKEQVEDLEMKKSADEDFRAERDEWASLREELEQKVSDAQHLADNVRNELEMLRRNKTQDELDIHNQHDATLSSIRADLSLSQNETSDLRAQFDALQMTNADLTAQLSNHHAELTELRQQAHDTAHTSRSLGSEDQERRLALLERELAQQEKLTNDVRAEAHAYLNEMRDLSHQHELQTEREERLETRVAQLESDNETWRTRYARLKTQNKNLRASTLGLGAIGMVGDAGSMARDMGLVAPDGLVKAADLTRFQLSLDDLLRAAREPSTPALLAAVKMTTVCVSAITATSTPDPSPLSPSNPSGRPESHTTNGASAPPPQRLRARALGSANALITAAKQHAASSGLSPVSLLDASAGNCCATVLEYVRVVRIAPPSAHDAHGDDGEDVASLYDGDGYGSDGAGLSTELVRGGSLDEAVRAMPLPPGSSGGGGGSGLGGTSGGGEVKPLNSRAGSGGGGGAKKGGWFGWGRGTASEDSERDGGQGEYDPYR